MDDAENNHEQPADPERRQLELPRIGLGVIRCGQKGIVREVHSHARGSYSVATEGQPSAWAPAETKRRST